MRPIRQLGTCGSLLVFGPLLWLLACAMARALGQHAFETNIAPATRQFRVTAAPELQVPPGAARVADPRVRTELEKYAKIWELEPGACAEFPEAGRMPFSFNPFKPSAQMVRLKQKQAFLLSQHHQVRRKVEGRDRLYEVIPDPQASLGGRRFVMKVQDGAMIEAFEMR